MSDDTHADHILMRRGCGLCEARYLRRRPSDVSPARRSVTEGDHQNR